MSNSEAQSATRPGSLDLSGSVAFFFSWLLVFAVGLLPVVTDRRTCVPHVPEAGLLIFLSAVASGAYLKRQYSWIGCLMHIISQILIWLSLFCVSLAWALFAANRL